MLPKLKFFISSNVELSYCWRFYRPITEGPLWKRCHEDTPLVNKLVSSEQTPFSVDPCEGNLVAKETKKFYFNFSPTKVRVNIIITVCLLHTCMMLVGFFSQGGHFHIHYRYFQYKKKEYDLPIISMKHASLKLPTHPPPVSRLAAMWTWGTWC